MIWNIQLLRGLAALAVVCGHCFGISQFQAVPVFFVISGFIMTHISRADAGGFLTNRLIRIVPLYWLATAVYFVRLFYHWQALWLAKPWSIPESLLFLPYLDLNEQFFPLLPVGWTLNLEIIFYILFGVALAINRRLAPLMVAGALLTWRVAAPNLTCGTEACRFYQENLSAPNFYGDLFIGGIAIFYVWQMIGTVWPKRCRWALIIATAIATPIFVATNLNLFAITGFGVWSPFWPFMIVVMALLLHSAGVICTARPLLMLGSISYALYLTHFIVLATIRPFADFTNNGFYGAFTVAASVVVAIAVHYWIERPAIHALRRILNRQPVVMAEIAPTSSTNQIGGVDDGTAMLRERLGIGEATGP
jgi:exopolysaccharide production protein ExoZ